MPTFAEDLLSKVEAVLSGRITADVEAYTLPDRRSITKVPVTELLAIRDKLRAEIRSEKAAASVASGLGNPNKVRVRF